MSKPVLGHAAGRPEARDDPAQRSIVHVQCAPPGDRLGVDAELIAVEEVSVDHRREEVRGRADGVDVTREVEVEILHGDDLRLATACAASFDAEDRAHGRLAQAHDGAALASRKGVGKADRDGRLALAQGGRRNPRDGDEPPGRDVAAALDRRERNLGLVAAIELELVLAETEVGGDILDRPERRPPGELEVETGSVIEAMGRVSPGRRAGPSDATPVVVP